MTLAELIVGIVWGVVIFLVALWVLDAEPAKGSDLWRWHS